MGVENHADMPKGCITFKRAASAKFMITPPDD
jgi:hypothetical protein